jgi:Ser/Thr protein kinase RdoA (MazF antagonist)
VPKRIGDHFTLEINGTKMDCELTEFHHGYQVKTYRDASINEMRDLGRCLALGHTSVKHFTPKDMHPPHLSRALGIPCGFVHNDMHPGNIIFDDSHQHVAGIVDFERARYRPYIADIKRVLNDLASVELKDRRFTVHYTPEDKEKFMGFLRSYNEERPLSLKEVVALEGMLTRGLWQRFYQENNQYPIEERIRKVELRTKAWGEALNNENELHEMLQQFRREIRNQRGNER